MTIDESKIPEYLRHIKFQPWHFWSNTYKGKTTFSLKDDFTDEMMRELKLQHTARVNVIDYGENDIIVLAEVQIYEKGKEKDSTPGFASVSKMPSESKQQYDGQKKEAQQHFAQLAVTRALSAAIKRHLGISSHDVLMVVEALGLKSETIQTRGSASDAPEIAEAPVSDVELDLEL